MFLWAKSDMKPLIITPWGTLSTFVICVIVGVLAFFGILHNAMKFDRNEEYFIAPKVVCSAFIACGFAALADSLFKINENGGLFFSGTTFYGGLIGAIIVLYLQLKFTRYKSRYTIKQWFDTLTLPFIGFHFFGRLGCFFGGCCYGKPTDSALGVHFPDNPSGNIYHFGEACYPTQLFEMFALMMIFAIVLKRKNRFKTYIVLYAVARFIIEFFRGDFRGGLFVIMSPAQAISIALLITVTAECIRTKYVHRQRNI